MLSTSAAFRKDTGNSRRYKSPIMQHRQFAAIAAIIARMPENMRKLTAEIFASDLHYTNPNFDRARFLKACGVDLD